MLTMLAVIRGVLQRAVGEEHFFTPNDEVGAALGVVEAERGPRRTRNLG